MLLEFHQLQLRYEKLRRRDGNKEKRLLGSLSERGQLQPVVVVHDTTTSGSYVLVDGYKRLRALRLLKQDTVQAIVWELGELEAVLLERVMRGSEADSALEQGFLLCELNERFGLSHEELARRFDKSPGWVSQRLGLVRVLPEQVQARVQRGVLPAHAASKYLLPMARTGRHGRADCIRLVEALDGYRPSSRDIAHLYMAWANADAPRREFLLTQPELVLRAREDLQLASGRAPVMKTAEQSLRNDFSILIGTSRRARNGITTGASVPALKEGQGMRNLAQQAKWESEAFFGQVAVVLDSSTQAPPTQSASAAVIKQAEEAADVG